MTQPKRSFLKLLNIVQYQHSIFIAILKAKAVMQTNKNRSKNFEIDAIPLMSDQSLKNQDFKEKKPRFKKFHNFLKKVKSRSLSSLMKL